MKKKITEHDAMKGVDLLLEPLTDEEKQRVFNWINLKYKIAISPLATSPSGMIPPTGSSPIVIPPNVTIKEFITLKKPVGFYERVACLAFHMEKFQNIDGFKTNDITKANTDAKQTKIPDSSIYVNNATKQYGFLISIGKGKKSLSARGEAVVNALPDRDKVTAALAEHPLKKKGSKKKGKSKKDKS